MSRTGARWLLGVRPRLIAIAGACSSQAALGAGLQVEPVQVNMAGRSEILWLSNTGGEPLDAQVRVYSWTQDADGDQMAPTQALFASPPIARIGLDGRQLVRLVRTGQGGEPGSCEQAFRLSVDEVPPAIPRGTGLRYVMRYSIPVFVKSSGCGQIAPVLALSLQSTPRGVQLVASNTGTMHAQLAQLRFVPTEGKPIDIAPGLLGYVLPGMRRVFQLSSPREPFAKGGRIEALINGSHFSQPVRPAAD